MTNIAELGFKVPTGPLKEGKAALDALVPSAQKAEKATDRFNKAAAGITAASGGIKSFASAADGAGVTTERLTKAALGAGTAMRGIQAAAVGASAPINNLVGGLTRVTAATGQADAHIKAYRASLASVPAAANSASTSLARLGAAANDNINRLQSTPGNIAAQFQDIGVTAAGGMDPLLIALQQGTQLSSAMAGGLGNLIAGFTHLFSVTTIVTIGLVALIAAGLQAVDWMRVAEVLAIGLADVLEEAALAAVYLGTVMAIAFGPRILASISAVTVSIFHGLVSALATATFAMINFSLANPFGAIVIAIGLVIGAMWALNDTFGGVFTGVLKVVKHVANAMINFFASAFNGVLFLAENTVNGIVTAFEGVADFLGFDVKVGKVDLSGARFKTGNNRDFVGEIGTFITDQASNASSFLRNAFAPSDVAKEGGTSTPSGARGQTEAERQNEAYVELIQRGVERINALNDEAKALGMTEAAARLYLNQQGLLRDAASQNIALDEERTRQLMLLGQTMTDAQLAVEIAEQTKAFKQQTQALEDQARLIGLTGFQLEYASNRQELVNDAIERGIIDVNNMTDAMRAYVEVLDKQAASLARSAEANRNANFTTGFTRDLNLQNAALERQRGEIRLTGAALTAYRIETDLLNKAARQNIQLTPEYVESVRQQAIAYGELTEQVRLQQEQYDRAREDLRGFINDTVSGLRQGESVWDAFGNAVINIIDRISARLLDLASDQLFNSLLTLTGGTSPGALSDSAGRLIDANPDIFAKGGVFDGGVQKFAKGGVFTNNVFSDPTMFKFAKGGAFGVMGEAGPEAVMPLKRGSDGSLGVRVTSMEPQQVVVRVVVDDDRFDAYVDDRVVQSAPQVITASVLAGESELAFRQSRQVG